MAAGYFLLTKSGTQFKFALKAGNHETILSSELYASKSGALNGIASVKTNSRNDAAPPHSSLTCKHPASFDWAPPVAEPSPPHRQFCCNPRSKCDRKRSL